MRRVRRWLQRVVAVVAAVLLLLGTAVASLIAVGADCLGPSDECPRSDAYNFTMLSIPVLAAVFLVGGAAWSILRRRLQPLVLAEAAVLALVAIVAAALGSTSIGTFVLLAVAFVIARATLRRRHEDSQ